MNWLLLVDRWHLAQQNTGLVAVTACDVVAVPAVTVKGEWKSYVSSWTAATQVVSPHAATFCIV